MPISVTCGSCTTKLKAPETASGRKVKCPKCGTSVPVPADKATPPAAAGKAAPVSAGPAPSDLQAAPAKPKAVPSRTSESHPLLSLPRLLLRPKKGFRNLFNTDLDIVNAETKEPVGVARDQSKKLFGVFKVNVNLFGWTKVAQWEIADAAGGPSFFTVKIVKDHDFVNGDVKGIDCILLDPKEEMIACFRYNLKGIIKQGWALSLLDKNEEEIARVGIQSGKVMAGEAPRIKLCSPDGHEHGSIVHKGMADVMAMVKDMKAQGKKFGMVGQLGEPGLEVIVAEDSVGNVAIHRGLLALAVLVEVTKIGKSQVSLRPDR